MSTNILRAKRKLEKEKMRTALIKEDAEERRKDDEETLMLYNLFFGYKNQHSKNNGIASILNHLFGYKSFNITTE